MYQVYLFNLQHFIMSWKILGPFDFDSNTSQKTTRWNKVVVLTRNIRSLRRQGIEKSTLESFSGVKMEIITFKDCCWRRGCTVRKCPRFCEKCCHQIKNDQIFPLVHFPSLNIWWFVLNINKIFSAQAHTGFTIILLWSKDKTESHDFYFYSTKSLQLLTQGSLFVCKDQQAASSFLVTVFCTFHCPPPQKTKNYYALCVIPFQLGIETIETGNQSNAVLC